MSAANELNISSGSSLLDLRLADCMDVMREAPDNHWELAIVDPPYGINVGKMSQGKGGKRTGKQERNYKKGEWDSETPSGEYFAELQRVSRNQIIWGANYYPQHLKGSPGWIMWDKGQRLSQADGELAYSSIKKPLRVWTRNRVVLLQEGTIHPCQKPVDLYRWLLKNYAKPGDRILDTHMGSGSIAIACHYAGHHLTACEIDPDYFAAACERIERETAQLTLFTENVEGMRNEA